MTTPWKQPKRAWPVEPKKPKPPTYLEPGWVDRTNYAPHADERARGLSPGHIASRLAIHEATHAAADFLLGMEIHSVEIGETGGIVRHVPSADPFNAAVALLAPHVLDEAFGWEASGDKSDEAAVDKILREQGLSTSAIPEARAVLEEAASKLVLSGPFDSLRRALSKHLKPNTYMTGDEAEEILAAALEAYNATHKARPAGRSALQRHSRQDAIDPWYIVSLGDRELYRGSSLEQAKRVQAQHPRSQLVGSIYS